MGSYLPYWHMWGNHIKIPMLLCLQPALILCAPTRIVLWFVPDTSEAFWSCQSVVWSRFHMRIRKDLSSMHRLPVHLGGWMSRFFVFNYKKKKNQNLKTTQGFKPSNLYQIQYLEPRNQESCSVLFYTGNVFILFPASNSEWTFYTLASVYSICSRNNQPNNFLAICNHLNRLVYSQVVNTVHDFLSNPTWLRALQLKNHYHHYYLKKQFVACANSIQFLQSIIENCYKYTMTLNITETSLQYFLQSV